MQNADICGDIWSSIWSCVRRQCPVSVSSECTLDISHRITADSIDRQAFEKLKDKAIVVVAGNPESRPELEAKGLMNYIHVKNNVLEELKGYQVKLGIK